MERETFSVRINPDLKRLFTKTVKEKGLSTCYVVEGFMTAWLLGMEHARATQSIQSNTINLTLQRVVQKVRRKHVEYLPEANHYHPLIGWTYHPDEKLNPRGHTITCECSYCRETTSVIDEQPSIGKL